MVVLGAATGLSAGTASAAPTAHLSRDYNCSDFSNQAEAEEHLLPGDPYGLDGDKTGSPARDCLARARIPLEQWKWGRWRLNQADAATRNTEAKGGRREEEVLGQELGNTTIGPTP